MNRLPSIKQKEVNPLQVSNPVHSNFSTTPKTIDMEYLKQTMELPMWLYYLTVAYLIIEALVKIWFIVKRKRKSK